DAHTHTHAGSLWNALISASVLKRWKLNWCDLWIDGSLCFYKTDSRRELEHRVSLKTACVDVRSGLECRGVSPPESNPRENLIVVQLTSGSTVNLCANSEDESIRDIISVPINSYHTVYITPGAGPGTHQVVVQRDPFDGVLEHLALGLLAGMAAGTAMRSFLWMPFLFC
uniref:Pleckstrin homology domain containing B1 n=1 Tax=Cyclopterus lumpus TaxID=8103 RepID=A0A8C2WKC0_CYCLU